MKYNARASRRFLLYLVVGGINTVAGYAMFAAFLFVGLHYTVAALFSTVLGILFNFQTTGRIVFGSRDPWLIFRFVGVYGVTYLLNIGVLRALEADRGNVLAVQAILVLPLAAVSFLLHQRFVFGQEVARS